MGGNRASRTVGIGQLVREIGAFVTLRRIKIGGERAAALFHETRQI
jgi:hypothetical protein